MAEALKARQGRHGGVTGDKQVGCDGVRMAHDDHGIRGGTEKRGRTMLPDITGGSSIMRALVRKYTKLPARASTVATKRSVSILFFG